VNMFKRNKLAAAVATLSLAGVAPAHAAFTEVTADNPFDDITSEGDRPSLVMMDLDADGDLDAVLFHDYQSDSFPYNGYGGTSVWENTGTASSPAFTQVIDTPYAGGSYGTGENIAVNPFAQDYQQYYGHPVSAADVDGDGDLDFFGGNECVYSSLQLSFAEVVSDGYGVVTGANDYTYRFDGGGDPVANPFYGNMLAPTAYGFGCGDVAFAAGDLDNDDDIDIVATDYNMLNVHMNDGTDSYGAFIFNQLNGTSNPFYGADGSALNLTSEYYGAPAVLHDVDGDGDLDLVMGTAQAGDVRLFVNEGTASTADFVEVTDGDLDVSTLGWAAPTFADIDNDGDDDLIVVEINQSAVTSKSVGPAVQSIRLFENDAGDTPVVGDDDDDGLFGGVGLGALLTGAFALMFRRRRRS
jgi:hypothetical protein